MGVGLPDRWSGGRSYCTQAPKPWAMLETKRKGFIKKPDRDTVKW